MTDVSSPSQDHPDKVPVVEASFRVDGMNCASCVSRIEKAVRELPGVQSVSVNLATHEARVRYFHWKLTAGDLQREISAVGCQVREMPGNDIEERDQALEQKQASELKQQKLIVAIVLSIPVVVISMSELRFFGRDWLLLVLTVPVVFWAGGSFFTGAWNAFKHRTADMNTLIAVGTGAAERNRPTQTTWLGSDHDHWRS